MIRIVYSHLSFSLAPLLPFFLAGFLPCSLYAGEPPYSLPYKYTVEYLDSMALHQEPGGGRPYIFSVEGSSFFYGTTQAVTEEGWMGFHWGENKLWNDWMVAVNGELLDRSQAHVTVKPHEIVFSWNSGIIVRLIPLGELRDDLLFEISGCPPNSAIDFYVVFSPTAILPEHKREKPLRFMPFAIPIPADTVCVGIGSAQTFEVRQIIPTGIDSEFKKYRHRQIWGASIKRSEFSVCVSFGRDPVYVSGRLQEIFDHTDRLKQSRKEFLLREINRSYFRCQNVEINQALNWAKIHLAGMFFLDDGDVKLWAGLSWFNDCWGRDTFISLPGACLVLGKFDKARGLLERFAKWQKRDPDSPDYGKIPNRVRSNDLNYHSADGTPWFVRSVYEYGLYSADTSIWREYLQPETGAVWLANEGTIAKRIDSLGFILHDDSETWMDAATPQKAWSPRADRSVEVQVLWLTQLEASLRMVDWLDTMVTLNSEQKQVVKNWRKLIQKLRKNIPKYFVRPDGLGLFDHLNPDGIPDEKIRPNQLFALTVPIEPLFTPEVEQSILRTVREHCIYEYGVASLAQDDPDFHPYHQTHHYPKDAAYHMGIVWTWLSGAYKSASSEGWAITESEIEQILNWGAFGTLSENLDAVPRDGTEKPYVSGTVSQTWSLAEFIRTWYQDYIGLKPDLEGADPGKWHLEPLIPTAWGDFTAVLSAAGRWDAVFIQQKDGVLSYETSSLLDKDSIKIEFKKPAKITGKEDLPYLKPSITSSLKSLQPPPYRLLTSEAIKATSAFAIPVLNLTDPVGDDVGDGDFGYPQGPEFEDGMLDLTGFEILEDHQNIYFKLKFAKLVDPGWHPEYGFQLTFATIAINSGDDSENTQDVGYNSNYFLNVVFAAHCFIHIGGGIDLVDAEGDILAKHIPRDENHALGSAPDGEINFALPRSLFVGDPSDWKITVLVGSQDDHGGAGIGEYREVTTEGGRWQGSGGMLGESNVYDILKHEGASE